MIKQPSRFRSAICLLLVALGIIVWPYRSFAAIATRSLANDNTSWNRGRFLRTGLASEQIGGVQLVPQDVGQLLNTTNRLPLPLNSQATTSHNDHIFVLGGKTYEGDTSRKTRSFIIGRLTNPQFGGIVWTDYSITYPLPESLSDASATVTELGGQLYLWVLGGQTATRTVMDNVSTDAIYYIPLGFSGSSLVPQSPWQTSSIGLPHDKLESPGRGSGAYGMGLITTLINGQPNLYIFGGFNRTEIGGIYRDEGDGIVSDVYRTTITSVGGRPQLSAWTEVGDIQTVIAGQPQGSPVALYRAAAVKFTDPVNGSTGAYIIGGTRAVGGDTAPSSEAFVVHILGDGTLQWLDTGSMSAARSSHAAIQAGGQILVSGGTPNPFANPALPDTSMARGFIGDDLRLYSEQTGGANFTLEQGAMLNARMDHTMATLSAGDFGDWYYVIGGQRQIVGSELEAATDEVLIGKVADPPLQGDRFVSTGKYYSPVYDLGEGAEFFALNWTTIMTITGQAIELEYHIGNTLNTLGPLSSPMPSVHGQNTMGFPQPTIGRYFQFVATLGSASSERTLTPTLDQVALKITLNGFPNLQPQSITLPGFARGNATAPVVRIQNRAFDAQSPVIDAREEGLTDSIYVDLYVRSTTTQPQLGEVGQVYAIVPKDPLNVDAVYTIPTSAWRSSHCVDVSCPPVDWNSLFPQDGSYNVFIMVDSIDQGALAANPFGFLREADQFGTNGETDNVLGVIVEVGGEAVTPTPTPTEVVPTTTAQATTPTSTVEPTAAAITATSYAATQTALPPPAHTATAQAGMTATALAPQGTTQPAGPPRVYLPRISK